MPAPVALFVYNRPLHTQRLLETFQNNPESAQTTLFIYADGAKQNTSTEGMDKIIAVRKLIKSKKWAKNVEIVEKEQNFGLANSVIQGVSELTNEWGNVIVLEDDLILSKGFLNYMNCALEMYAEEPQVAGIGGYFFPTKIELPETFFSTISTSWGWGTWKRVWCTFETDVQKLIVPFRNNPFLIQEFNCGGFPYYPILESQADGKIDSWAIRFYAHFFLQKQLFLFPHKSLVNNIGHDDSGTHCTNTSEYSHQALIESVHVNRISVAPNSIVPKVIAQFLKENHPSLSIWHRAKIKARLIAKKYFQNIK